MTYLESSAKTGRNINEIFVMTAQRLVEANPQLSDPDRQQAVSEWQTLDFNGKKEEAEVVEGRIRRCDCLNG